MGAFFFFPPLRNDGTRSSSFLLFCFIFILKIEKLFFFYSWISLDGFTYGFYFVVKVVKWMQFIYLFFFFEGDCLQEQLDRYLIYDTNNQITVKLLNRVAHSTEQEKPYRELFYFYCSCLCKYIKLLLTIWIIVSRCILILKFSRWSRIMNKLQLSGMYDWLISRSSHTDMVARIKKLFIGGDGKVKIMVV